MHKKKTQVFVICILSIWMLGACTPTPPAQNTQENEAGVYFPQLQPMEEMPLALMYGQLVNDEGCLRVVANEGAESYLVLWPGGDGVDR